MNIKSECLGIDISIRRDYIGIKIVYFRNYSKAGNTLLYSTQFITHTAILSAAAQYTR